MTIGERIKELRLEKGMSQEELGKLVGVQRAAINKYEKGLVVNLKREVIAKLATALGTTPTDLMGWTDEDKKEPTVENDGLPDINKELIEMVKDLSEEDAALLLAALKAKLER